MVCEAGLVEVAMEDFSDHFATPQPNGTLEITLPRWRQGIEFQEVIFRHGPPEDFFAKVFPKVAERCGDMKGLLSRLDLVGQPVASVFRFFEKLVRG